MRRAKFTETRGRERESNFHQKPFWCFAGPLHRGASDRRRLVQDKNPLLLFGPDARHQTATRREELSHILSDASWSVARGKRYF